MIEQKKVYYGLPEQVKFCKKCVISNQRPASTIEFKHSVLDKKKTIAFNKSNICDACTFAELKKKINWDEREKKLEKLLDNYRKNDGSYDCIIPGSGGKDSVYASHILKYKYNMNPLTVTWPPILYTDYGYKNFLNWLLKGGFPNYSIRPNPEVMRKLTKLSIENLFHPFQTFILGQKSIAAKVATELGIPLVFYGENEAEYGNSIADNSTAIRDDKFHSLKNINEIMLGGIKLEDLLKKYKFKMSDLQPFLPPLRKKNYSNTNPQVHYLGYYLKWNPQEAYYYAVENTDFSARPFRTQGTYSKYNSIDDKIDDLHYYTTYIKFGIGRASYDASQEIRNNHISREEGIALVKKFDGEFPDRYFDEILDYLEIKKDIFFEITDKFRSPHLWKKVKGEWKLRHTVFMGGVDD